MPIVIFYLWVPQTRAQGAGVCGTHHKEIYLTRLLNSAHGNTRAKPASGDEIIGQFGTNGIYSM
jgi:hypothetical protein